MYRRILVAVDESEISRRALAEALSLIEGGPAVLRIVHVVDTVPDATGEISPPFEEYREAVLDRGRQVLAGALQAAREAGVDAEPALVEVEAEPASAGIVEEARRWGADLIAIGTHGRSGWKHLLLGSVAEGVVRHAPVPVLLVRGSPSEPKSAEARRNVPQPS